MRSEAAGPGTRTRRDLLKMVGLTAAGVGVAAAVGVPLSGSLFPASRPRSTARPSGALRIDGLTIVDPLDGSLQPNVSVLMDAGSIRSIGPSAGGGRADATVVDGRGRFAVPGYNNMHTHVLQQQRSELLLATMLAEGTTGMRQMAGTEGLLRDRAQNRLGLNQMTPALLEMPGNILMPWNGASIDRVRHEISRQKDLGADFIKLIQVDRDVFFAAVSWAHEIGLKIGGHLPPSVSPAEASDAGYDSLEHLGTSSNIWIETSSERHALRREEDTSGPLPGWLGYVPFAEQIFSSGPVAKLVNNTLINPALSNSAELVAILQRAMDSFDDAAATRLVNTFAKNGSVQTPTLSRLRTEYRADDPEYVGAGWLELFPEAERDAYNRAREKFIALPASTKAAYHQYYTMTLSMVGRLAKAGVPIMAGTDGPGVNPGQGLHEEFHYLAAAGLSPLEVLQTTTSTPASYLGRSDRMGAIRTGMAADMVLLESNPLESAANLRDIGAVVRAGYLHTSSALSERVDRLAAEADA